MLSSSAFSSPSTRSKVTLPTRRSIMEAVDEASDTGSSQATKKQKAKSYKTQFVSPLPWLCLGLTFTHPLVFEMATIQVSSMANFALANPDAARGHEGSIVSSQRTVSEPRSPGTPDSSYASTVRLASQSTTNSQASTVAPWSPRALRSPCEKSGSSSTPQVGGSSPAVPHWFLSCFEESDGYDSNAVAVLAGVKQPPPTLSTPASSPEFVVVPPVSQSTTPDVWVRESWPADVEFITAHKNPRKWSFKRVPTGVRDGAGCGCLVRCNALRCKNAHAGRFCTEYNYAFTGVCGNALIESNAVALRRNVRTGMRGVVAVGAIPVGEVFGQFFGVIELLGPPCSNAPANEGYRMHLRTRISGNKFVGIDALYAGGMTRMMNHSCKPAAYFHEVQCGVTVTVVAVTIRDVYPGDEITVSYGDRLWFSLPLWLVGMPTQRSSTFARRSRSVN